MLVIVLGAIGIDPQGLALIIAIDRPLDMLRTVVNVTGDTTVATVIASGENGLNVVPEEDLDIESVEDVNIETDNTEIEDDTVLIEDESDIDPTINVGIKNIKEEEENNN